MRTQTLKLGEPPPAAQPDAAVLTPPAPAEASEPPAETVIAARGPEPVEADAAAPAVPPASTPPAAPVVTPPQKAVPAEPSRKTATAAPAPPTPPPAAAGKGSFTVQLGSFGDEANARRLADRSATFGYKASVTSYKTNGKTMYRVRLGSYAGKTQAEAAASALTVHGITAKVVAAD
jgi:cell division protein FtsN